MSDTTGQIAPFEVTAWVDEHAHGVKYDLAGSVCSVLSIRDLIALSTNSEKTRKALDFSIIDLDYNSPMRGGHTLRGNLAALYSDETQLAVSKNVTLDHILTTNAGIDANFIVLAALIRPTDHVICHYPTYQQLYEVPRYLGASVSLWKCDPSNGWKLDLGVLQSLFQHNTRMIILNVPQNPGGSIIPQSQLDEIVSLAKERDTIVFCDEAFRPLFHGLTPSHSDYPKSVVNMDYEKTVATGTMSKAFSLPGIRAGWIVSRNNKIIEACFRMRYYTTTTVSQLNEAVAAEALSDRCINAILNSNVQICDTNIRAWQNFIEQHDWACSWVKPVGGTTALVKFVRDGRPVDDVEFCLLVQEKAQVCLIPARRCFGDGQNFEGYVRIGVGLDPTIVREGLLALSKFMRDGFASVATLA